MTAPMSPFRENVPVVDAEARERALDAQRDINTVRADIHFLEKRVIDLLHYEVHRKAIQFAAVHFALCLFLVTVGLFLAIGVEEAPAPRPAVDQARRELTRQQDVALCTRACVSYVSSVCSWEAGGVRSCECGCLDRGYYEVSVEEGR